MRLMTANSPPVSQHFADPGTDLQATFDVAVVMPSILAPSLRRAVESVYSQTLAGRIQILIGIDQAAGSRDIVDEICRTRPGNCILTLLDLGYSTSVRHGGLHAARDGGAMRTVLSYLANSPHLAYLDDDNWWRPDHLSSLHAAIQEADWAFGLRWFVDHETQQPLCVDAWESVGPGKGTYAAAAGGFVDPSSLMINKQKCEPVLRWWSIPVSGDEKGMSADRHVFSLLKQNARVAETGQATTYYVMDPTDAMHPARLKWIAEASS